MVRRNGMLWVLIGTIVVSGGASRVLAQEECAEFRQFATDSVPMDVGDEGKMKGLLLPAVVEPQLPDFLAEKKNLNRALKALGAKGLKPEKTDCRFDGKFRKRDVDRDEGDEADCMRRSAKTGEALRLDLADGRVTYLNPERDFDPMASPDNTLDDAAAQSAAMAGAIAFGVPEPELGKVRATRLKAASVPIVNGMPEPARAELRVAEVHVLSTREVAGTPVFGSTLKAAVDARGQVARLHIRWPRFCVVPGLADHLPETLLSRDAVIDQVVETLAEENHCGTLSRISAQIMYVRSDQADGAETTEGGDEMAMPEAPDGPCYAPALVVHATPVEPEEDSGQVSMGAPEYVVPLFGGNPARG